MIKENETVFVLVLQKHARAKLVYYFFSNCLGVTTDLRDKKIFQAFVTSKPFKKMMDLVNSMYKQTMPKEYEEILDCKKALGMPYIKEFGKGMWCNL